MYAKFRDGKISIQLTTPVFSFILFFLLFQCIPLPLESYFTNAGFPSNFLQNLHSPKMLTMSPSFLFFPSFCIEKFTCSQEILKFGTNFLPSCYEPVRFRCLTNNTLFSAKRGHWYHDQHQAIWIFCFLFRKGYDLWSPLKPLLA